MMAEDGGQEFLTLHEIARAARARLPQGPWDYLAGAAVTETTLRRNRHSLDTLALRPRVCRDVSSVDTGVELLGERLELPVMLAPVGSVETFVAGGGATAAGAATRSRSGQLRHLPSAGSIAGASASASASALKCSASGFFALRLRPYARTSWCAKDLCSRGCIILPNERSTVTRTGCAARAAVPRAAPMNALC